MGMAEGLSATISQHNGGTPSFEELWASAGDSPKLDIWWRDAITDLEENLGKWVNGTSNQYNSSVEIDSYSLTLNLSDRWNDRLAGVLKNKMQYYFVHCVMAGWLQDFPNVSTVNYSELAQNDLHSVLHILMYRNLETAEEARTDDGDKDSKEAGILTPDERTADADKDDTSIETVGQERTPDADKDDRSIETSGDKRTADADKDDTSIETSGQKRTADTDKDDTSIETAGQQRTADKDKDDASIETVGKGRTSDKEKDDTSIETAGEARTADKDKDDTSIDTAGTARIQDDDEKIDDSALNTVGRAEDKDKDSGNAGVDGVGRTEDKDIKDGSAGIEAGSRTADADNKTDGGATDVSSRAEDSDTKIDGAGIGANVRHEDAAKQSSGVSDGAYARKTDAEDKDSNTGIEDYVVRPYDHDKCDCDEDEGLATRNKDIEGDSSLTAYDGASRDKDDCHKCCMGTHTRSGSRDKDDVRHATCHSHPWTSAGVGVMTDRDPIHRIERQRGDLTDRIFKEIDKHR